MPHFIYIEIQRSKVCLPEVFDTGGFYCEAQSQQLIFMKCLLSTCYCVNHCSTHELDFFFKSGLLMCSLQYSIVCPSQLCSSVIFDRYRSYNQYRNQPYEIFPSPQTVPLFFCVVNPLPSFPTMDRISSVCIAFWKMSHTWNPTVCILSLVCLTQPNAFRFVCVVSTSRVEVHTFLLLIAFHCVDMLLFSCSVVSHSL